ncbi:MAG: cell division protein FtsA [Spirochaetia bacterium]|nr:cell division protein FtsA [Spirochaetia bacterium]
MEKNERIITAIDLGSSKTTALTARVLSSEEVELIGIGVSNIVGVKAGAVTNIEQTVRGIKEAVEEAELMSGANISNVIINISGKHVKGDNSTGVIAITNKERIVTQHDILRVIDAAQAIRIPADQEILHVLSREFRVDDQNGIKDPTGMVGVRLESEVHIVTGSITHIQNTEKAVNEAGVSVTDRVLSSLASSHSFLSEGEKELGVAIVDIGAGVMDLIIYIDGGVSYTSTICIGSQHLTQDISIGLKTPIEAAELIKKREGYAIAAEIDPAEIVEVPSVGDRPPRVVPRKDLAEIMEARIREILELIDHELIKSGKKGILAGGIVFTGGGSLVEGLIPLAEETLQLGASLGFPKGLLGITDKISSPIFSTAVGMIRYAAKYGRVDQKSSMGKGILSKMKYWIQENL